MGEATFLELAKLRGYAPESIDLFQKTLDFARPNLSAKERLMGDTFYDHAIRIARILANNKVAPEVIVAGILYNCIDEECFEKVKVQFDPGVLKLISGIQEIKQIKTKSKLLSPNALRKLLLTTIEDVRVIIIKLAVKLDNLRTIHVFPPQDQQKIAEEVLEVYAPLANRLGMDKMRVGLEDSAFRVLNSRKYWEIKEFLEDSRVQQQRDIAQAIREIKGICQEKLHLVSIKGRPKNVYSIYRKIQRGKNLRELFDLLGIRIIVPTVQDCYVTLGLLHEKYNPIEGRLKDYIANPKPNFYRSLHTGLLLPNHKRLEVQIRTPEMDEVAEEGLAAHWRYKKLSSAESFEKKIGWLRSFLDAQQTAENKELLETVKIDVFGDTISCYTPKGDVKELPKEATVLDFAFSIHEQVGNTAVAGRVNGKFVRLKKELQHGDVIEIITNKNQRPRRSWLKIVKSSKSKQKIRKSLKEFEKLPALHYRTFKPVIKETTGILVESEEFPNATCVLAKCCHPIPGDEIVGIVTKRRVISVHKHDCKAAIKEQKRWVPVNWKETFNQRLHFNINAAERRGLLPDLLNTIANAGFEVKEAKVKLLGSGNALCSFIVIPRDLEEVKELIVRVNKVKGIHGIYFE